MNAVIIERDAAAGRALPADLTPDLTLPQFVLGAASRRGIKYKGYQVAPAEFEAVLLTHPAVADVAVVRRPDARAGEVPKAFVVLQAPASAQALMAWVAGRVASYKRVRQVEFIDSIPKSPTGKILRRLLVERDASTGSRAGSGDGGHDH